MYNILKWIVLKFVKVPPEPADPMGDVESLVVFRASPNYLRYRVVTWAISSLFGFGFWLFFVGLTLTGLFNSEGIASIGLLLLLVLELLIVPLHLLFSYTMIRLDYEMRWYKVTDRSLRIREGVYKVREMTMMFDNIQNITVTQGPIQRMLNIADLQVQSAGGGGVAAAQQQQNQAGALNMHVGYFRGIDNAQDILKLMQHRLKMARSSGLGDHDDVEQPLVGETPAGTISGANIIETANELLEEARAFRVATQSAAEKLRAGGGAA